MMNRLASFLYSLSLWESSASKKRRAAVDVVRRRVRVTRLTAGFFKRDRASVAFSAQALPTRVGFRERSR